MGFYNPSVASDPNPVIFSEAIKAELMSDHFQAKDKEYGDIDGDGDVDILYTKNNNELWLLRNSGHPDAPEFLLNHAIPTGLVGVYGFKFLDWYGDGVQDLLTLEKFGSDPPIISLYIDINSQLGFPTPAAVLITGTTVPLNTDMFIEVGLINDDIYPDILISGTTGIHGTALFTSAFNSSWNLPVAPPYRIEPPQTFANPLFPDDGGSVQCPELFDADCDGDLDLFISDPIWSNGGGHVDFYRLIDKATPQLSWHHETPNPYGFDETLLPSTTLHCDWVVTRFADFFGDGSPEAIAYDPCNTNHPNGDMLYYKNGFECAADFSFSSVDGCQVIQFTDLSNSSNTLTYSWNFGDPQSGNNTSVIQNPNHYFSSCGTYNVCLTISGGPCVLTVCHSVPVIDLIPPVARCLSGIGIVMNGNCIAVASPSLFDNGSTDNCQIFSMTISQDTFTQCGIFPIIFTVMDLCGNTATCTSNVQVHEDVPPVLRCPPGLTITSTSNSCTKAVNGIKWTLLSDNCSTPQVTYIITGATIKNGLNDASGVTFNSGTSTVTYKAVDDCGNSSTCSFDVKVVCACNCPNNILQNPGFFEGAIAGSFTHGAHSNHWLEGTYTPQVVSGDSCCDNYSMQMWGYKSNGESIVQQGLQFKAGHHYKISFCGRYVSNTSAGSVNFGFTAANSSVDPYQCTTCDDIGSSPKITSTSWNTFSLPIWTPKQNWDRMYVRVFNLYGLKAWGRIDNICVSEVQQSCCADEAAFIENMTNAVHLYAGADGHTGIFDVGNLPACDYITTIDWGDGHITPGPISGDSRRKNYFINNIKTRVQYTVVEYNLDVIPPVQCFQRTLSDSLVVPRPGVCACTAFGEVYIRGSEGEFNTIIGDDGIIPFTCLNPGSGYTVTGSFSCAGNGCSNQTPVFWNISGPSGINSGITYADPYFGISLLPSYMTQPGAYTFSLEGHCGNSVCNESIQFTVSCPDICPCQSSDVQVLQKNVEKGFTQIVAPNSCQGCFSPVALDECETVLWYLNQPSGTPIGMSSGTGTFCYIFPQSGTYTVFMVATRNKANGSLCGTFSKSQSVDITCSPVGDCTSAILSNPHFKDNSQPGEMSATGRTSGWKSISGHTTVIEGAEGSLDNWTILLAGNLDSASVLTRTDPICLEKIAGYIAVRIAVNDSAPGGIFAGRPINPHKPCDKIKVQLVMDGAPFRINHCDGIDCFELASATISGLATDEWHELQIPYDLSQWITDESCGGFPGVLVRPVIYVTNGLREYQGEDTYSIVQLDNFCFNGTLVGVNDPLEKHNIRIYPNPSTGEFTVILKDLTVQRMSLRIINLAGQNVMEKKFEEGKFSQHFNAGLLNPGMYFLQIISDGHVVAVNKMVIQ